MVRLVHGLPAVIATVFALFLFQKKAAITVLVILLAALALYRALGDLELRGLKNGVFASAGMIVVFYIFLVLLPVYSGETQTIEQALGGQVSQQESQRRRALVEGVLGRDRRLHLLAYATLAPLTRTAAPAMLYPSVFPERHEFYGLDLGQDILGWGRMPDDNRVVWEHLYPDVGGGSVAAPFQFVLYSQVGTIGALALSAILGFVLGGSWGLTLYRAGNRIWRSLLGSMLILYSIYLAIDSARGGMVSSYGVFWGIVFTGFFWCCETSVTKRRREGDASLIWSKK